MNPFFGRLPHRMLDYWPLGRLQLNELGSVRKTVVRLVVEKVPFLVLATISCAVTYLVQQSWEAVGPITLILRIPNILNSYLMYIEKMIWPSRLAAFYPYPVDTVLAGQAVAGALLLLVTSIG